MMPPRLHVLLARDSPLAVVMRRGPTRHTAVIGWDRKTDRFALGQWLYGRIYERRSDLSPDGRHLIYFAMNGKWSSGTKGSWTAISRAPWLKADVLYGKGDGWCGGGLFTSNSEYFLDDCYGSHRLLHDHARLKRTDVLRWPVGPGGECPRMYFARLQRDGWELLRARKGRDDAPAIFEKPVDARWNLRKLAHATLWRRQGRSVYFDTHELRNARTGECIELDDWEWADVDGKRLVWAADGRLHAGRVHADGSLLATVLNDFSDMRFERRTAPY
ncbi:MAG TPA: hypothetical protein VFL14_08420 [Xanthomonadales bacterium]|nr:hypothetical protein [Xanthomonadales bacterium]